MRAALRSTTREEEEWFLPERVTLSGKDTVMLKKLLVFSLASVLAVGAASASDVWPPDGGGIPIEPPCEGECDPFVVLPGGTVCTLAGCVSGGGNIFCLYSCF